MAMFGNTAIEFYGYPKGLLCEARVLLSFYAIVIETILCRIVIIVEGDLEGDTVTSDAMDILTSTEHDLTIGNSSLSGNQRITL